MIKIALALSLLLAFSSAQTCSVLQTDITVYPSTGEVFVLPMSSIFSGDQLTYSETDSPVTLYQFVNTDDGYQFLNPIYAVTIYEQNFEWANQIAVLAKSGNNLYVYSNSFSYETPTLPLAIPLYQGSQQLYCQDMTYINADFLLVDCFTYDQTTQLLTNQWQIINTDDVQDVPVIIPSSNNLQQKYSASTQRKVLYWSSQSASFVYRGVLGGSAIEIFQVINNLPSTTAAYTIDNTFLKLTSLNLVDFEVLPSGELWVLDATTGAYQVTFSDGKYALGTLTISKATTDKYSFTGLKILPDYSAENTYAFLVATDSTTASVLHYLSVSGVAPALVGAYVAPISLTVTNGVPVALDMNRDYVSVQFQTNTYIFSRGIAQVTSTGSIQFTFKPIQTFTAYSYVSLNQIPEAALLISTTNIYMAVLTTPRIQGMITGSGTFTLTATTPGVTPTTCTSTVNYKTLAISDTTLYQIPKTFPVPSLAIYPDQYTYSLQQYFSGPTPSVTATITQKQQVAESFLSETTDPQQSYFVYKSQQELFFNSSASYPTTGVLYAKNILVPSLNIAFQLFATKTQIELFACAPNPQKTANPDCNQVGTLDIKYPINNLEFIIVPTKNSVATIVFPISATQLQFNPIQWDPSTKKGSIGASKFSLSFPVDTYNVPVTSFSVIGDNLYVVLQSISQIWGYAPVVAVDTGDFSMSQTITITASIFGQNVQGFAPTQVVGNFPVFGPILFINNQVQCLIVAIVNNQPTYINSQDFPFKGIAAAISSINVVGTNLIITSFASNTQQEIIQYNLADLGSLVISKQLPLYSLALHTPLITYNDQNFLYVLTSKFTVLVYNPALDFHSSLVYQFQIAGTTAFFSSASYLQDTIIVFGDDTVVNNYYLNKSPSLEFVPGAYNNAYSTDITYSISISNGFSATPITQTGSLQVQNSQLGITINTDALQSNSDILITSTQQTVPVPNLSKIVSGSVAWYDVSCTLCVTGEIKIQNILETNSAFTSTLTGVQQMISVPTGALVATVNGLFLVNNDGVQKDFVTFNPAFLSCSVLTQDTTQNIYLSICSSVANSITMNVYNAGTGAQLATQTLTGYASVSYAHILGNQILLQAAATTQEVITIFTYDPTNQAAPFTLSTQSYNCGDGVSVSDFDVVALWQYTINKVQYSQYALFYTCLSGQTAMQASVLVNGNTVSYAASQTLTIPTTYKFQENTLLNQILGIGYQNNVVRLVITTNNMMNFVVQYTYTPDTTLTTAKQFTVAAPVLQTTLPPYGKWNQLNQLYYNSTTQQLFISYLQSTTGFTALYNLNQLPFDAAPSQVFLMAGGYQISLASGQTNVIYQLINQNQLLYAAQNTQYKLSAVSINQQVSLVVNAKQTFDNQVVTMKPTNTMIQQSFTQNVRFPVSSSGGLKWWAWLLIAIGIVLVIGGIVFGVMKWKSKQNSNQPLLD